MNFNQIKVTFEKRGFKLKETIYNRNNSIINIAVNENKEYIIKIQIVKDKNKKERMKNESLINKSLNSTFIIKTYAIYSDLIQNHQIYSIVMEKGLYNNFNFFIKCLLNDNLIHVINNTINFPWIYLINSNTLSFFITQIIEGLKVLFEHNIVHRDIKGENIIITYLFKLKIADFGIAKKAKSNFELGSFTWCYQSFEYFINDKIIDEYDNTFKIDYYCLGVIIYYCLFRKELIDSKYKGNLKEQDYNDCLNKANENINKCSFENNKYEIKNFDKENKGKFIQKGIGELTKNLLTKNISERPNIFQLLDDKNLNENKLYFKKIYNINQFLESKLFIEFMKPNNGKRKRKKYNT